MGILGEQQKIGAVQQAQGQQALDLAYQDFLKQKNYPYQQLAFMSDMVRGLPLSQSAQQVYAAPPNVASQLGGLGMAGLGIYGMSGGFKAKEGGQVPSYKEGGEIGYFSGGELRSMSTKELTELLDNPGLSPIEIEQVQEALMVRNRMENNPEAMSMMGRSGVGAIGTGSMVPDDTVMAKEGGIMSFSTGGVKKPEGYDERRAKLVQQQEDVYAALKDPKAWEKTTAAEEKLNKSIAEGEESLPYRVLTALGIDTAVAGSEPGGQNRGFLGNLALGGKGALGEYGRGLAQIGADRKLALQQGIEAEKAKYGRDVALHNALMGSISQLDTKELGFLNAKNAGAAAQAQKDSLLFQKATSAFTTAVTKEKEALMRDKKNTFDYTKNPAKLEADAQANVIDRMKKFDPEALKILRLNPDVIGSNTPAPVTPPPAPKASAGNPRKNGFIVTVPGKGDYTFPTQEAADQFKKRAGLS
jgi:hypothetical protein